MLTLVPKSNPEEPNFTTGFARPMFDVEQAPTNVNQTLHAHAAETPPPSVPDYNSLSPDALMSYCSSRLNSLDTQMQSIFKAQQNNAQTTTDLDTLAASLNDLPAVTPASTPPTVTVTQADYQAICNQYQAAIDDCVKGSSTANSLQNDLDTFQSEAAGCATTTGPITADQVTSLQQNIKNQSNNLNSDSQMSMIDLQSLMSQRETAVQLTTNLVQSLGQQTSDITKNVGQ